MACRQRLKGSSTPILKFGKQSRGSSARPRRPGPHTAPDLNQAQQFAQASLAAIAPELQQVPVERWAEAIQIIAGADPQKGQAIVKTLTNAAAIEERQQLVEAYQKDQQRQGFESLPRTAKRDNR